MDTVTYDAYTRPDTGKIFERNFRSDRSLPNDQTSVNLLGYTPNVAAIRNLTHLGLLLVPMDEDGTYTEGDAPVRSQSALPLGMKLWSAAGRVCSDMPFLDYRDPELGTERPSDEKAEAEEVRLCMEERRTKAKTMNGGPETITSEAKELHSSMC